MRPLCYIGLAGFGQCGLPDRLRSICREAITKHNALLPHGDTTVHDQGKLLEAVTQIQTDGTGCYHIVRISADGEVLAKARSLN